MLACLPQNLCKRAAKHPQTHGLGAQMSERVERRGCGKRMAHWELGFNIEYCQKSILDRPELPSAPLAPPACRGDQSAKRHAKSEEEQCQNGRTKRACFPGRRRTPFWTQGGKPLWGREGPCSLSPPPQVAFTCSMTPSSRKSLHRAGARLRATNHTHRSLQSPPPFKTHNFFQGEI